MTMIDRISIPEIAVRRFQQLGVDHVRLLKQAGLRHDLLNKGQARLTTAEFFKLWHAVAGVVDDPSFGLRLGSEVAPGQFDVASMAAAHAQNLRDALAKMARYKRLVCPEEIRLQEMHGEASVEFDWVLAQQRPPALLMDSCFAAVLLLARYGSGQDITPLRVEYSREEAQRSMLEAHFKCPVIFDAKMDRIVFDAAILDIPFKTYNPDLLALLIPGLDAQISGLQQNRLQGGFVDEVKLAVRERMQGQRPSVGNVASDLALSMRSLQRRLAEHGTSYQQVLDEVRQQTARQLLRATPMETAEIAFLLGFEELNSFNRAFQGWEGVTPQRWREAGMEKH
ncbi:AraC family transcriptional regulator [Undibacterium sp.]|uniref:AraC family transcriptional regulator n=1 Tax=Undibacterium sp. TaxID=1914977 RepID=UPI00374DAE4A